MLRRQALCDNPSLKDLLINARAQERSEAQATAVEKGASPINAVKNEPRHTRNNKTHGKHRESKLKHPSNTGTYKTTRPSTQQCRNCGGIFPHIGECPAKGKECRACGKSGHFAKVCRSKTKRQEIRQAGQTPTVEPNEEPNYIYSLLKPTINIIHHHTVRYTSLTNQFKPSSNQVLLSILLMNPHMKRSEGIINTLHLPHNSPRYTHMVQIWNFLY